MALSRAWQSGMLRPVKSASVRGTAVARPVRLLHSSRTAQASQTTSNSPHEDDEHYPAEGFSAPIWRNTILLTLAAAGIYRLSMVHADPHPSRASSSGRSAPGNESEDNEHAEEDDARPFLTKYIAYHSTPASVWKERNERHLELMREKAEEKLLFQDAERPPIHRLRYASTFEQASPHCLGVGRQADLSDLNVKKANE